MIGQTKLLTKIDKLVEKGFPRFTLLVGTKGSGKKLMCKEIANKLNYPLVPIGITVDEVREVITNCYRNTEPIIYILPDTDKMSVQAKNALLKVTEEPPQKAYFIQTITDISNTLKTITSRACVIKMDGYTPEELNEYLRLKYNKDTIDSQCAQFITKVARVPEEVDVLMTYDIKAFKDFVETVTNNLHIVSSANAFKIEHKLALKKDEDKWDVLLFINALKLCLLEQYKETKELPFLQTYFLACVLLVELTTKNSVNKQYCLDQFILDARKCWRQE